MCSLATVDHLEIEELHNSKERVCSDTIEERALPAGSGSDYPSEFADSAGDWRSCAAERYQNW